MIHILFIVAGAAAGFHAYTYSRWLKQQSNLPGAIAVLVLAAASIALPVYHVLLQ
ncbi:MAG: hypothetical protein P4N41_21415 [Negativicutes bacterium]|nr:hypothetical protein [Negativicutes bacterium]